MGAFRNFFATINAWLMGLFQPRRASTGASGGGEDDTRTTLTPEQLMQTAMHEAMQLTETTEDVMEKGVFQIIAIVSYVLPFLLAVLVGTWIGEGLSAITKVTPDAVNTYKIISTIIEMTVPIASITCARAVKRVRVDPSAVWILIAGLVCFLLISAGSAIAQWILYTSAYNPIPTGVAVVALFRGCAPVIADLICAVFLALHGYKSLRRRLAQLDERAEAVEKIYARQVVIIEREEKLRKEREDAEAERRRRDKREEMLDRVQEMQTTSMLDAMEYVLTIPQNSTVNSSANGSRQQRGY